MKISWKQVLAVGLLALASIFAGLSWIYRHGVCPTHHAPLAQETVLTQYLTAHHRGSGSLSEYEVAKRAHFPYANFRLYVDHNVGTRSYVGMRYCDACRRDSRKWPRNYFAR